MGKEDVFFCVIVLCTGNVLQSDYCQAVDSSVFLGRIKVIYANGIVLSEKERYNFII